MPAWRDRSEAFCRRFGARVPVLLAPMAGVDAPELSASVARAGGLGACGALLMSPGEIGEWARTVPWREQRRVSDQPVGSRPGPSSGA